MFEKAARLKLRFETPVGLISVEELWDLPLTSKTGKSNLDTIARDLNRKLKDTADESFVDKPTQTDSVLQLKFEIVKHVIDVLVAERDAAAVARVNREKKQEIMSLIAEKKNDQLKGTSLEDLEKMAAAL
jgi:hypothetical protein